MSELGWDGIDGSAVLDGTVDVPWARRDGMTYVTNRDADLTDLTVCEGVTLTAEDAPTPWQIRVLGDVTNYGYIHGTVTVSGVPR